MKLKFINQQYQKDAVDSICDIFDGCQNNNSLFTIDLRNDRNYNADSGLEGRGVTYTLGYANKISIDDYRMLSNVQKIQERNDILKTNSLEGKNFTVEMETGTGKTYVYINTILELNKRYGLTKFIIVVPSIAIKEGVYKSLQITEEHFKEKYDNVIYSYFFYNSEQLNRIQSFATSTNIEIMVINIDAFRKSFDDPTKENKSNIIHRPSDKLSGNKPIDLIAGTNPIVIIDEPQSVDSTKKSKEAISSLNPGAVLRYSATHKELYNLMYRLTPVDAYHEHLVKQIEVASVTSKEASTKPYVKLLSVSNKNGYSAKLEIYFNNEKSGSVEKKVFTVGSGDDLWELSNEVDYYKESSFIVGNINCSEGEESISFANGEFVQIGQSIGDVSKDAIKRAQIRQTIQTHLDRELHYIKKGIKVLSLFFIDEVQKYRDYEREDEKGDYAIWFEEEYNRLMSMKKYATLVERYGHKVSFDATEVHDGYFSTDGKGRLKNTSGSVAADETTYQLIMKDKEKLLSLSEPIRFIFSHSALKEGWDNPNVFQVCTLIETKDTMTKRQKIGRGLRLCVDQSGNRVEEHKYNVLTVVANESYKDFASSLQKELETDNFKFGVIDKVAFAGLSFTDPLGIVYELNQEQSIQIYDFLKENEYINTNGKTTQQFYIDLNKGEIELPSEYEVYTQKVLDRVVKLSREIEVRNANEKIEVKINKDVQLSDDFINLWNKIKQKTMYSVNMDINRLKDDAITGIKNMPRIKADQIDGEIYQVDLTNKGVEAKQAPKLNQLGKIDEFEKVSFPDFIRRLQDSTGLLRKTIIEVIAKSGRLQDFYVNPEEWIKQVSKILNTVKKENLVHGIRYHKIEGEYYEFNNVFDDTELYGYENKNILKVNNDKNIYDHVIYDSNIEEEFAKEAEADEDVILYAKLPSKFKIDTPVGKYNPDWALVLNTDEGEKLYFVAETKGNVILNELKGNEKAKILCGKQHFEVIDQDIRYEVVDTLRYLKNNA